MSAYITSELRRQVRDHFSGCCAYCKTPEFLTAATFEVEHIIPRSASGDTVFANLCLSCPTCNRCKANRTEAFDPLTKKEVVLFHPQIDAWSDHFAWNENATEIIGLSATGRATIAALRMNRLQLIRVRRMWAALGEHPPDNT